MAVLVTGGAGYIGSHTALALLRGGYDVVVADNLANSKREAVDRVAELAGRPAIFELCDFCSAGETAALFDAYSIDAVIHFAGLKAVGESVEKPLEYYYNNLTSTLNILSEMKRRGLNNFVFSSSATVYGDPASLPVKETAPLSFTNPYGATKLMIEDMLRDIARANSGFNAAILRYFNPIGADESGRIGEDPFGIPNNLMPYIAQVAIGRLDEVTVYGDDYDTPDGTGVRDYIHVSDLADGHVAALKKLVQNPGLVTYNLGTGCGYSVLEVISAFERASGRAIPYVVAPRRAGDVAANYADATLAETGMGWRAARDLDDMCKDSWNWQRQNPNGYED